MNVSDAASELGVASADLRRLLWAKPHLTDAAVEMAERRLDVAEKNIIEALHSDDSRRRDAASFFVLRNTANAKRRGWITSSSSTVDVNVNANVEPRVITYRWRTAEDDARDRLAAEAERLTDEGSLIEHEASRGPSNKD
jgi:hypothetical protein